MAKLILAFCNFANARKKVICVEVIHNLREFIVQDFIHFLQYYPLSPWVHVIRSRGSVQTFMTHFSAD